jgi:hypothetical protein
MTIVVGFGDFGSSIPVGGRESCSCRLELPAIDSPMERG